jgi:hypothetical protein
MIKKWTLFPTLLTFVLANAISTWSSTASQASEYTQPPVILDAQNVLPKNLLQGENYKVEAKVKNDGLINNYQLTTDYGPLTVESTAELLIRITELKALVIMEEMDRKKVFGDALVEGVKAPVKGVVELVKSPIDTSKNIVKGTGEFLSNVGSSIFSDAPDQDNVFKVALGYDAAKRQFAFEFGIDPYTDYDPVVDRLGEIARAAVAGGLTPKAAMAAVDNDVVLAMQISGTAYGMMQLVRDNPPNKLADINREKLKKMGVDESLSDAFLENYRYNPQEETILIGELESMKGVEGFDVFISKADLATEETIALSYRIRAQMMAGYHLNVTPLSRFLNIDGVLIVQTKTGALALLAPADYVAWTQKLEGKIKSFESSAEKIGPVPAKELWITGKMDKTARVNFESHGWKVTENANDTLIKK